MVYDIIDIVRVYGVEVGGYGLGMSDGRWWWYSEVILYVIYGMCMVWY